MMERSVMFAWLLIAAVAGVLLFWAFDRSPPFELKDYTVFNGRRGETLLVSATVHRAVDRSCSVTFSRYLFDAKGVRTDLSGIQYMTASALEQMNRVNPDRLLLNVKVPDSVQPGPAKLVTSLEYVCNPIQRLWPIDVLLEMNLVVLP
jgi:hypothetical protein